MRKSAHGQRKQGKAQQFWKVRDVASLLNVSYRTVWRMAARKQLEVVYLGNRLPRIPDDSLQGFLERRAA